MVKLSEKEKAAHKAAFQAMSPAEKAEHIFTYHKWTILLILLVILVLSSILHRQLTQKKPVLYLAVINISFGEEIQKRLTEDFLTETGGNPRRQEVYLYRDLYLSEDADALNHEYAYASKVKLGGAISAEKLDLVLMNREASPIIPWIICSEIRRKSRSSRKRSPIHLPYLLFRCFVKPVLTEISI